MVSACNSRKDRRIRISGHHLLPRIVEQLEIHEILKKENESWEKESEETRREEKRRREKKEKENGFK